MRGKVFQNFDIMRVQGITPAYAGKSYARVHGYRIEGDHPRVCGEKHREGAHSPVRWGSPPRMRGKVTKYVCKPQGVGITPAYAGKSAQEEMQMGVKRDHPRVCGEKRLVKRRARCLGGSPPRMRGKACRLGGTRITPGITPAYAGKSKFQKCTQAEREDHPRVCGEKNIWAAGGIRSTGSPPRMRGKAKGQTGLLRPSGITPAYAGKSLPAISVPVRCLGSPPRMRGKVLASPILAPLIGITPAYAGKSRKGTRCRRAPWDHPRVCGEKTKKIP